MSLEGGCLKHISDTKDLFIAGAFKIHVYIVFIHVEIEIVNLKIIQR